MTAKREQAQEAKASTRDEILALSGNIKTAQVEITDPETDQVVARAVMRCPGAKRVTEVMKLARESGMEDLAQLMLVFDSIVEPKMDEADLDTFLNMPSWAAGQYNKQMNKWLGQVVDLAKPSAGPDENETPQE